MIEYIEYIIVSYNWKGLGWCTFFLFIYFWLCWVYFELWYWGRLLRVPWMARRSNQSILKEINPEYSLEGLILKLKLWYFSHLMWRTDSLEKTLMLGKIEGRRRRGQQKMRWESASPILWTWVWASSRSWWWTGKPGVLQSMGLQSVGHNWATELNWTELCWIFVTVCRLSLVAVSLGYSLAAVRGLLIAVVSLVAEHRL